MPLFEFCVFVGACATLGLFVGIARDTLLTPATCVFEHHNTRYLVPLPRTHAIALSAAHRLFPSLDPNRLALETCTVIHPGVRTTLDARSWQAVCELNAHLPAEEGAVPVFHVVETEEDGVEAGGGSSA
ncbi:hypothetical protein JCM10207_004407 [Rhodosporidiobolus poonsookiae]